MSAGAPAGIARQQMVLLTLAAGQFLMTLDSSVMNVAIATVAKDVGTTVTGIQMAITLYTLVMAMLMVSGGKVGSMTGRRRAFAIGCVIYGLGSLTTALAPNLAILVLGWSVLEGIGAALILPAIVALVAGNFLPEGRPRAYGLVMGAGAIAVALGPLIGGVATTYFSWRWVFAGEVVIVAGILALARRVNDAPPETRVRLDVVGAVLAAVGLGSAVFGVLRSAEWGWVIPKSGGPAVLGVSPTVWFILGGLLVLWLFFEWENHVEAKGREPLVRPSMFGNRQMTGGLLLFFFQYLVQAGLFFTIPLFLSVSLGLSAVETGVRILPLSITLLAAAIGVPRFFPDASPRRVVRLGVLAMFAGIVVLFGTIDANASAEIVTVPLLLAGLGIGALASQLGAVTVSAVPDKLSAEVGGVQNTGTNLGAAVGTALAGSILIAALTASFLQGVQQNPSIPQQVKSQASVQLAGGVPFLSDADLQAALKNAGASEKVTQAVLEVNEEARIAGLRSALAVLALIALLGLFFARRIPTRPQRSSPG
ncbi:MFS transporter [Carbonactinospora thermoautotrophica]|uniref:MFS transporter n=1 Tax=Carbonactinospora thermoautotrophica TaxID=1469144 RepID=UPI00083657F2|nr:MFS transporter [Carbonactinospora thermoautotrophica]